MKCGSLFTSPCCGELENGKLRAVGFGWALSENGTYGETKKWIIRQVGCRCPRCGTRFAVELNKMRVNAPNPCPSCGVPCVISDDQAIRAHRLLDWFEYRERTVSPIPDSGYRFHRSGLIYSNALNKGPWITLTYPKNRVCW